MSRSLRSVLALLVVALCAGAVTPVVVAADDPQASQSAARERDPRGGPKGGGPGGREREDPRCRSIEHRVEGAQEGVGQAQITLRQANRKVAAKQRAVRGARGRRAKARAQRQLRSAKRAQRAARGDVRSAKARLEATQRQARQFDCST
jgi:hypothetical protein